jgi:ABC-type nitrate/sulfonate/bicarbonate transport system permease component
VNAQHWQRSLWVSWLGVIVVLVMWQAVNTFEVVNPRVFPGPLAVLETALTRFPLETLLGHISASLMRVAAGFALGAGLGIALGIIAGWYRVLGKMLWGPIEILRPIPPLAWIPIALIWFGLGESSKVFIIFLGAFFPIITNTYKGMATIDPMLIRAAQTMGVSGLKMLAQVAIPASLPDIAVGIRVGWSLSFGSLVAAEILAASEGLGFMIMYAREQGEINVIVYGIILIGVLNLVTDFLIYEFLFKRRLRWHFGQR